jgi:hypothetical protein
MPALYRGQYPDDFAFFLAFNTNIFPGLCIKLEWEQTLRAVKSNDYFSLQKMIAMTTKDRHGK